MHGSAYQGGHVHRNPRPVMRMSEAIERASRRPVASQPYTKPDESLERAARKPVPPQFHAAPAESDKKWNQAYDQSRASG